MLTDIFAERYRARDLWKEYGSAEQRLLIQAFQLISAEVLPFRGFDGKVRDDNKAKWERAADLLKRELGVSELAPAGFLNKLANGNQFWVSLDIHAVAESFVCKQKPNTESPDRFVKERLSFVELILRKRDEEVQEANSRLEAEIADARLSAQRRSGLRIPGDPVVGVTARNSVMNEQFQRCVEELNERFKRANAPLQYHNGFIQLCLDEAAEQQISIPFWKALAADEWRNVRHDMSQAIDLRDSDGRDPAFYAARALESTIKIISDKYEWTTRKEKGAFNFIENLSSAGFIEPWEREALQMIFKHVRNPLSHGPGSGEMPELTPYHTNWAIETCMSWAKSLVQRQQ